ncbi:MAG: phosphohistidine phosphatase SixA [Solirubrobacteraceae bacterium]
MKRLYLLRHAKSSWKEPGLSDHDRPLAGRGRRAANAIARHLREQGIEPQLVLCSPARRARETLEPIEPALGRRAVRVEPELYGASVGALLEQLRAVRDDLESVMLVGHNPGLQQLALALARPAPELDELEAKYPTAALVTLAFPGPSWRDLDRDTADLVGFVRPRDLP